MILVEHETTYLTRPLAEVNFQPAADLLVNASFHKTWVSDDIIFYKYIFNLECY